MDGCSNTFEASVIYGMSHSVPTPYNTDRTTNATAGIIMFRYGRRFVSGKFNGLTPKCIDENANDGQQNDKARCKNDNTSPHVTRLKSTLYNK